VSVVDAGTEWHDQGGQLLSKLRTCASKPSRLTLVLATFRTPDGSLLGTPDNICHPNYQSITAIRWHKDSGRAQVFSSRKEKAEHHVHHPFIGCLDNRDRTKNCKEK
jgi:hypothetical protein